MQDEARPQMRRDLRVRVERGPKEPAIRATKLLVKPAKQTQRQYRFATRLRGRLRLVEVRVPVETRRRAIALRSSGVSFAARAAPPLARPVNSWFSSSMQALLFEKSLALSATVRQNASDF